MNSSFNRYKVELTQLEEQGMLRAIPEIDGQGKYIKLNGKRLLNLSSNDYLGIFERKELKAEFLEKFACNNSELPHFSSASSRLLTGNNAASTQLEELLAQKYGKESALIFNSGYHANTGILPALCSKESFIIADKFVHASIIDGIKLSGREYIRFKHNNIVHLRNILKKEYNNYSQIFIVTEGIFSMGGDRGIIKEIVELKEEFPNCVIYVDEAHSFGVCGEGGLGIAQEQGVLDKVDIIIGTFGKAISSVGAYAVMPKVIREYLVNKMRPLIFSTSLPPINIEWSKFIIEKLESFTKERAYLREISKLLSSSLGEYGESASHIITYVTGSAESAVTLSKELREKGIYALPVRPPTVAEGSSGVRISLTAAVEKGEILEILEILNQVKNDV